MELPSIHDPRFEQRMRAYRELYDVSDDFADLLQRWRRLRGEAIMTDWSWCWADEGEHEFSGFHDNREAAIEEALAEGCFFGTDAFEIIEARCWMDDLADDDFVPFAATRHRAILHTEVDDDGVRRVVGRGDQAALFGNGA